jgi:tetratricopeptide (TPR) repeat protein
VHTILNWTLAVFFAAGLMVAPYIASPAVREPLQRANADAQAGQYEAMAKHLREVLAIQTAPGVLHNLGNAEYRSGHLGKAILAWERAHALQPSFRNTTANLRFARGHAGLEEPTLMWDEKYSSILSPDVWLWTATIAFWGAIALLAWPYLFKKKRTAWTQGGAVVAAGVFLLTLPALAGIDSRTALGVIVTDESLLRLTPTHEGEVLGKLSEGELARAEKRRGQYVYVRAASDRAGWVRQEEFTRIWP